MPADCTIPHSTIRVRLYRWDDGPLDEAFWSGTIAAAVRLRHEVLGLGGDESAYRLVFSEGDGLSGLTVDRYDRWLVVQFTSLALYARRELSCGCSPMRPGHRSHRSDRAWHRPEGGPAGRRGDDARLGPGRAGRDRRERPDLPRRPARAARRQASIWISATIAGRSPATAAASACSTCSASPGGFSLNAVKHGGAARDARGRQLGARDRAGTPARHDQRLEQCVRFEAGDVLEVLDRLRGRRRALRRGHLRPAEIRPAGQGRRECPERLPAAQPGRDSTCSSPTASSSRARARGWSAASCSPS